MVERLKDFMKVAATLSMEDYLEQFPHPMFFYSESKAALDAFVHTQLVDTIRASDGSKHIDRFSEQLDNFVPLLPNTRPNREFPQKAFIGRHTRRDFVINHSTVSNRHACLFCDKRKDEYKLVDSGSTNGTMVRGRSLEPGVPISLRDGDVVTFGRVSFIFFSPKGAYRYLHQYRLFREAMQR